MREFAMMIELKAFSHYHIYILIIKIVPGRIRGLK
jgi:hypothetical protein